MMSVQEKDAYRAMESLCNSISFGLSVHGWMRKAAYGVSAAAERMMKAKQAAAESEKAYWDKKTKELE